MVTDLHDDLVNLAGEALLELLDACSSEARRSDARELGDQVAGLDRRGGVALCLETPVQSRGTRSPDGRAAAAKNRRSSG